MIALLSRSSAPFTLTPLFHLNTEIYTILHKLTNQFHEAESLRGSHSATQ
jgi:hypothetical protein